MTMTRWNRPRLVAVAAAARANISRYSGLFRPPQESVHQYIRAFIARSSRDCSSRRDRGHPFVDNLADIGYRIARYRALGRNRYDDLGLPEDIARLDPSWRFSDEALSAADMSRCDWCDTPRDRDRICEECSRQEQESEEIEEQEDCSMIHSYHCGPRHCRHERDCNPNARAIGIELEVDSGKSTGVCFEDSSFASDVAKAGLLKDYCTLERDGTLSEKGVEIITCPASIDMHRRILPAVIELVVRHGGRSHNAQYCGLHVHVSRSHLTRARITDGVAARISDFVARNEQQLQVISRRPQVGLYSSTYRKESAKHKDAKYRAVNSSKGNTIEYRLWKGTLKIDTLFACVEASLALTEFGLFYLGNSPSWADFIDYLKASGARKAYPALSKAYLDPLKPLKIAA